MPPGTSIVPDMNDVSVPSGSATHDVVVIGGGPAGLSAAIALVQTGATTALIARQCITNLIPRSVVGLTLRLTLEINPRLNSISLKLLTNTPTAIRKIRKHLTRLILIAVMA